MKAQENFRFIDNYPDYLVGDFGTVYSTIKRKELAQSNMRGYRKVTLINDMGAKDILVHILVANAFLPRIDGKNFVDHIDGNRSNNIVTNLRWCTFKENCCFPIAIENKRNSALARKGKPVIQYDLDGNVIARFRGQNEAGRLTGISGANISQVCNNKRKTAGGFIWRYEVKN